MMATTACSSSTHRPKIGVGVIIGNENREVLIGKRLGSTGAGTYAVPGGHLEYGETWAGCASRELAEETGLHINHGCFRTGPVLNIIDEPAGYHYVCIFMIASMNDVCMNTSNVPINCEPEKCEGWKWVSSKSLDNMTGVEPLFYSLQQLRERPGGITALLMPDGP